MIGRVGEGGVDHGTPERLFEMVGRSMLSWLTSPSKLTADLWPSQLVTGTKGLKSAATTQKDILVNNGKKEEQGMPSFSSLGYSRLSVGVEYFREYCVQRIVKMVADFSILITSDLQKHKEKWRNQVQMTQMYLQKG